MIIHISDLHFGNCNQNAIEDLKRAITEMSPPPDFIVVTGDLTNTGSTQQLNIAKDYLMDLLARIWSDRQHRTRCIVVPGNHDVQIGRWKLAVWKDHLKEWNDVFGIGSFCCNETNLVPASLLTYYENIEQRKNPSQNATAIKQNALASAQKALNVCEYFPEYGVAFVKVNSVINTVWWPLNTVRGDVTTKQLIEIEKILTDYKRAYPSLPDAQGFESARLIALMHHHVTYLPNVKYESMMLMNDAGEVWQRLAKLGFDFILHGHHHRAAQLANTYWEANANNSELSIMVLSAGSASAYKPDDGRNSFYSLLIRNFKTEASLQTMENNRFTDRKDSRRFIFNRKLEFNFNDRESAPLDLSAITESLDRDKLYDTEHRYTLMDVRAVIDEERNYHGFHIIKVKNTTSKNTNSIIFPLAAVGAQIFDDFHFFAYDHVTGDRLIFELLGEQPITVFPIRVFFNNPLPPEIELEIYVSYKLPHVMHQINDYDFINLSRYPLGVEKLSYQFTSTQKILSPKFMAVFPPKVNEVTQPLISIQEVQEIDNSQKSLEGYSIEISQPSALCYIFYYQKLCSNGD